MLQCRFRLPACVAGLVVTAWLASASAYAHDLGLGGFDLSSVRSDLIEFVNTEAHTLAPLREQSGEELELQAWVDSFVRAPGNRVFFEGREIKIWIDELAEANAGALSDGQISVSRGLIDLFKERVHFRNAILAHELAHVSRAHVFRLVAQKLGKAPLSQLGGSGVGCGNFASCKKAFSFLSEMKQSRAFEFEADHVALELMDHAGMDPALLPLALRALEDETPAPPILRPGGPQGPREALLEAGIRKVLETCSSHPRTCDRVSSAFGEIEQHRYANAWSEVPKPEGALLGLMREMFEKVRL